MRQTELLWYADGYGYQAVELLYDGGELSMVLLLPPGQFKAFEWLLNAQRANPHHGTVGRAFQIGPSSQTAGDSHAAIEWARIQPEDICLPGFIGIIPSLVRRQRASSSAS